jgi:hypothetical protein
MRGKDELEKSQRLGTSHLPSSASVPNLDYLAEGAYHAIAKTSVY